tara:strand:+ start:788 stop:1861 length:1074 start_codon:yes stop_codon:yes gene_type:complete
MPIINKGTSFSNGEQLTAEKINNLVDDATFDQSATDSASTTVNSTGQIIVADGGITPSKLSSGGPSWDGQTLTIKGDGGAGGLEINSSVVSTGPAFIDFHSRSASNPDYDARIISDAEAFQIINKDGTDTIFKTGANETTRVRIGDHLGVAGNITNTNDTGHTSIYGGTQGNGANIELYSGSHATAANKAYYDATEHNFRQRSGTQLMQLDSAGKLLLGTTTPPTSVSHSIFCTGRLGSLNTYGQTSASSANLIITSTGLFQRSTSSARYKENVQDYEKGIDAVKSLHPVTYESINEDDDSTYAGFIAEEVHEAGLPEFVDYNAEGQPDALHYANMTALLTKALQEAIARIEVLEAK